MKISISRFVIIVVLVWTTISVFCEQKTHTVQKGETLYSISKLYGLSVTELRQLNGMSDSSILKVGQVLNVSAATESKNDTTAVSSTASTASSSGTAKSTSGSSVSSSGAASATSTNNTSSVKKTEITQPVYDDYTVKAGDTFYSIARANDISVAELKKINGFDENSVLKYGVVIKIPSKSAASSGNGIPVITSSSSISSSTSTTSNQSVTNEMEEVLLSVTDDPRKYDSNKKGNVNLDWPVKALEVTYVSGKIYGVSLTSTKNEDVVAIKEGTVTYSGFYRGFGNVVFVKSASNYIYVYSGLGSVSVSLGDTVKHSDKIGTVGTDSLSGKSQISLMVYKNGKVIDPALAPRG
ncbi:MAG: LysM peptidoglycan-binding domain-containing M23 family metallopeptidase [Treponemataceae bacterium]|nr:LysM peptidoglycan-binding domain-containing M23 family metallopeptidase [Treponemataceae bacterium]